MLRLVAALLLVACTEETSSDRTTRPPTPSPGRVQLGASTYGALESAGTADVTITRTSGTAGEVSVTVQAYDDTASSTDFASVPQTLVWADGESGAKTYTITITADEVNEL